MDGVPIDGKDTQTSSLIMTDERKTESGTFTVVIKNAAGSTEIVAKAGDDDNDDDDKEGIKKYEPAEAKEKLKGFIDSSKDLPKEDFSKLSDELKPLHMAAAQTDALVDVYYYSQNAACKKGMNMSAVFDMVHAANMAKRDPATGEFIKRADGKIIKPAGWKSPDVEGEVVRQHKEGSFTPL